MIYFLREGMPNCLHHPNNHSRKRKVIFLLEEGLNIFTQFKFNPFTAIMTDMPIYWHNWRKIQWEPFPSVILAVKWLILNFSLAKWLPLKINLARPYLEGWRRHFSQL